MSPLGAHLADESHPWASPVPSWTLLQPNSPKHTLDSFAFGTRNAPFPGPHAPSPCLIVKIDLPFKANSYVLWCPRDSLGSIPAGCDAHFIWKVLAALTAFLIVSSGLSCLTLWNSGWRHFLLIFVFFYNAKHGSNHFMMCTGNA